MLTGSHSAHAHHRHRHLGARVLPPVQERQGRLLEGDLERDKLEGGREAVQRCCEEQGGVNARVDAFASEVWARGVSRTFGTGFYEIVCNQIVPEK